MYHRSFEGDLDAERMFCRLGVCDFYWGPAVLRSRYGGNIGAAPPEQVAVYLRRDPTGAYRWEDMGESLGHAGRTSQARYCFQRAVTLAPAIPAVLYRAAYFHFSLGEKREGIRLIGVALGGDPADSGAAYEGFGVPVREILDSGLPSVPEAWRSFLRWQMEQQRPADAAAVWARMLPRAGYVDQALAKDYVNFLLGKKQYEAAVQAWAAGAPRPGYPDPEHVYNGDFEGDPVRDAAFDWRLDPTPGVEAGFDLDTRHSGARSLKLQFDRAQNPASFGVAETVYLKPGSYRFRAWVKSKDLSTDQGISLEVTDESGRAYFTTEPLLGSTVDSRTGDWKLLERTFQVGESTRANGGLQRITLTRTPTQKFDDKLNGTLWMDDVSIQPVGK